MSVAGEAVVGSRFDIQGDGVDPRFDVQGYPTL